MSRLDVRSASEFSEKTLIRSVNTFQLTLNRLTWQRIPMRVCRLLQLCKVHRHRLIVGIRKPSVFIPLALPLVEMLVHLPHIVKQIAKTDHIRLVLKLVCEGSQDRFSRITRLSRCRWVANQLPSGNSCKTGFQRDINIIIHFRPKVK